MSEPRDAVDELIDDGIAAYEAGELIEAARLFRRAADAGSAVGLFDLANTLRDLGRGDAAEAAYREAITLGEEDALVNLASLLHERGARREALRLAVRAARAGDPKGQVGAAVILDEAGHERCARELLERAVDAGSSAAAALLGCLLWDRDRDERAEPLLVAVAEEHPEARAELGRLYAETGRAEQARATLEGGVLHGELESFLPLAHVLQVHFGESVAAETVVRDAAARGDDVAVRILRDLDGA